MINVSGIWLIHHEIWYERHYPAKTCIIPFSKQSYSTLLCMYMDIHCSSMWVRWLYFCYHNRITPRTLGFSDCQTRSASRRKLSIDEPQRKQKNKSRKKTKSDIPTNGNRQVKNRRKRRNRARRPKMCSRSVRLFTTAWLCDFCLIWFWEIAKAQ